MVHSFFSIFGKKFREKCSLTMIFFKYVNKFEDIKIILKLKYKKQCSEDI